MQTLSAEYGELQTTLENLQKEESEIELQLSTMKSNVFFSYVYHHLEGKFCTVK